MKTKLVVLTEIVSPYRIPVFNALAARDDIDLHLIFLAETDPTQREWLVYKDEIKFAYKILPSWRRRYGKYNILLNRGLGITLKQLEPDVLLCGGYNYIASWQALAWARAHKIPFLAWVESTARDFRRNHRAIEFLKRKFISNCDAFVVPGKSSTAYMRKFNIPPSDIFVAPNAIDVDFFSRKSDEARADSSALRQRLQLPKRYFLYVGRLVKDKGVLDLLNAYGSLSEEIRKEFAMVFVGNGPARSDLMKNAARIKGGTVKFAGFVQRDELPFYYALGEACFLPTYSDTWGLVVNEAMACGLPVIVTDVAGCAADLVEDRWNGFVVSSRRPSQLASAMEAIAVGLQDRRRMGLHSRERILQYSPQICAAGIARAAISYGNCHA